MKNFILSLFLLLSMVVPAIGNTGGRVDSSGFLVYTFLGLCGLIVALQVVPMILVSIGLVKGISSKK